MLFLSLIDSKIGYSFIRSNLVLHFLYLTKLNLFQSVSSCTFPTNSKNQDSAHKASWNSLNNIVFQLITVPKNSPNQFTNFQQIILSLNCFKTPMLESKIVNWWLSSAPILCWTFTTNNSNTKIASPLKFTSTLKPLKITTRSKTCLLKKFSMQSKIKISTTWILNLSNKNTMRLCNATLGRLTFRFMKKSQKINLASSFQKVIFPWFPWKLSKHQSPTIKDHKTNTFCWDSMSIKPHGV